MTDIGREAKFYSVLYISVRPLGFSPECDGRRDTIQFMFS